MTQPITGIFVPHIVPYDASGKINEGELRNIINWLGEKGITGFYPNGSMGEFIRLSYEERKRVVKIVSEEANGKPILAGAAEPNVDLVLEMCNHCASTIKGSTIKGHPNTERTKLGKHLLSNIKIPG